MQTRAFRQNAYVLFLLSGALPNCSDGEQVIGGDRETLSSAMGDADVCTEDVRDEAGQRLRLEEQLINSGDLDCGKLDLCDISGSVCSCTSQDCEVSTRSSIVDLSLIDDDQSLIGKIAEQDVLLHRQ